MERVKEPVAVVPCPDYEQNHVEQSMNRGLDLIHGLDFVKPGMKIAIKLNLVTAAKPEQAATTHPALVKALCRAIIEKGGIPILGDSPGGPFLEQNLNRIYKETGMTVVSQETGALLNHNFTQENVFFAQAKEMKSFKASKWLMEADGIINFGKLKTHGMMNLSAAVKNMYGTIPGMTKTEYHFRFSQAAEFAGMLIDLNEYWKPSLNIVDGVVGMEGNGPTAGTPRKIGAILLSRSSYELDLVCEKLIGLEASSVLTTKLAYERGFSSKSAEEVNLIGSLDGLIVSDYRLISRNTSIHFMKGKAAGKLVSKVISFCMVSRPKVNKDMCIGCGKCREVCPAKAIVIQNGKPKINRSKCIQCFCCQEFCPKGAMM